VDEVIKDSITDEGADWTRTHLKPDRGTKLKFTFGAFLRHVIDEAKQEPSNRGETSCKTNKFSRYISVRQRTAFLDLFQCENLI